LWFCEFVCLKRRLRTFTIGKDSKSTDAQAIFLSLDNNSVSPKILAVTFCIRGVVIDMRALVRLSVKIDENVSVGQVGLTINSTKQNNSFYLSISFQLKCYSRVWIS
jgi:hypothetical protein